jgi:hypothetical protein
MTAQAEENKFDAGNPRWTGNRDESHQQPEILGAI